MNNRSLDINLSPIIDDTKDKQGKDLLVKLSARGSKRFLFRNRTSSDKVISLDKLKFSSNVKPTDLPDVDVEEIDKSS
jgi:hypothetical protein